MESALTKVITALRSEVQERGRTLDAFFAELAGGTEIEQISEANVVEKLATRPVPVPAEHVKLDVTTTRHWWN